MKRRSFLIGGAATFAAPSLPLSFAKAELTGKIATISEVQSYNHYMVGHTLAIIRTKGTLSLEELMDISKLTATQAKAIIGELSEKGMVTSLSQTSGMLSAIEPAWVHIKTMPIQIVEDIASNHIRKIGNKLQDEIITLAKDEAGLADNDPFKGEFNQDFPKNEPEMDLESNRNEAIEPEE